MLLPTYWPFEQHIGNLPEEVRIVQACLRGGERPQTQIFNLELNFGPQWMRNPPQQEPFPQRTFPLAQYRYGREEMLAIFEQIGSV